MKKQKPKLKLALACVKEEGVDFGLYLDQSSEGIFLRAKLKNGGSYTILSLLPCGRLYRYGGIPNDKLQTDKTGRIKFKRGG